MVETARDADGEAFGWESFDDHRNAIRERDGHGDGLLSVRAATEAVVLVLGSWSTSVILDSRLAATQLRHEQVRRRPRQQEAGHDADNDVPADCAHWCRQDTCSPSKSANRPAYDRNQRFPMHRPSHRPAWRTPRFRVTPGRAPGEDLLLEQANHGLRQRVVMRIETRQAAQPLATPIPGLCRGTLLTDWAHLSRVHSPHEFRVNHS